ncbi:hypothetical protein GCM10010919_32010 [Alishewanella longhuensis]|uniref:Uncharacterized protein n=1 Tax=Alishewanella longhuensis TaxID=1091037 RepID=A0ABQ3L2K3_9ALTE|nr:hypothetical protein [Alishewanella longhuensis]GHG76844.1 hypothetical protein GCM10010919_32010 [Alishewanella longhuensis]
MLKLSRRNWNNVLIFLVLILMYSLYDWSGSNTASVAEPTQLVPEQAQLLSVSVGNQRLVQAAGQWQLQPVGRAGVNAQQMASAWQYSILQPVSLQAQQSWVPVAQASVQLVGELTPQIWLLYPEPAEQNASVTQQKYLLQQVGQSQLYQLSAAQARLLFLVE